MCPGVAQPDFCRAFIHTSREAEAIRSATQREVTARERFGMLFERLNLRDGPEVTALVEAGIAEHMRQLGRAMEFPESHRAVLDALQGRTNINHDGLHTSLRTNRLVDLRPFGF